MIEKIKHIFIVETNNDLDSIIKEMESESGNNMSKPLVEKVFRTMHTIKGSAPMFGFPLLSEIAIPVAKAYEGIHYGNGFQSNQLFQKTTDVINVLHKTLHSQCDHLPVSQEELKVIVDFFNEISKMNENSDDR